jgi:hypothetical protein
VEDFGNYAAIWYFLKCLYILWPFGISIAILVYIFYILVSCTNENLATLACVTAFKSCGAFGSTLQCSVLPSCGAAGKARKKFKNNNIFVLEGHSHTFEALRRRLLLPVSAIPAKKIISGWRRKVPGILEGAVATRCVFFHTCCGDSNRLVGIRFFAIP